MALQPLTTDVRCGDSEQVEERAEKKNSRKQVRDFLENLNVADFCVKRKKQVPKCSLMIESFFIAYEKVVTRKTCRASFPATGVSPYDPTGVL